MSLLRGALWPDRYCSRMALLLGKQVLEVELGLDGTEHEVGVVEAQVLFVGVGGEGADLPTNMKLTVSPIPTIPRIMRTLRMVKASCSFPRPSAT